MLRISSRLSNSVTSRVTRRKNGARFSSNYQKGGGSGNITVALVGVGGVTLTVGGIVGYASWSPSNRMAVEERIAGSKYLLNPILGPAAVPELKPILSKKSIESAGLLKKKMEREKQKEKEKKVEETPVESSIIPPLVLPPPSESGLTIIRSEGKPTSEESTTAPESIDKAEALSERLTEGDLSAQMENERLSSQLQQLQDSAQCAINAAMHAAKDAAEAIKSHAQAAYGVVEGTAEGGEDERRQLLAKATNLGEAKGRAVSAAEASLTAAQAAIDSLKTEVDSGLESAMTSGNSALVTAKESLSDAEYSLSNVKNSMAEALRDSSIINKYRELVESGRSELEAEVRAMLPEVQVGETNDKLTIDELNLLIAHAHRKILQLTKLLARQQSLETEHLREIMAEHRDSEATISSSRLQAELDKQRRQMELEYHKKVAQLQEELEVDLRAQLRRQAAAHSDHLADVLTVQEKELESRWLSKLNDDLATAKDGYTRDLAVMQGQLSGFKTGVRERAEVDRAVYEARRLWQACEAMLAAINKAPLSAKIWQHKANPLQQEVNAIKEASGKDEFVDVVLNSLSQLAMSRGVYTTEALKERFTKVNRVARKVALIDDNGGSLFRYALSYVQNLIMFNTLELLSEDIDAFDREVPVDTISVYDILARAKRSLDKDDLEQAVRYVNLLRGEPRNVASDWLKEARLTLEARQAVNALLAHAGTTSVRAV